MNVSAGLQESNSNVKRPKALFESPIRVVLLQLGGWSAVMRQLLGHRGRHHIGIFIQRG